MENRAKQNWTRTLLCVSDFNNFWSSISFSRCRLCPHFIDGKSDVHRSCTRWMSGLDLGCRQWNTSLPTPRLSWFAIFSCLSNTCLFSCFFKFKPRRKFSLSPHPVTLMLIPIVGFFALLYLCQFPLQDSKLLEVRGYVLFAVLSPSCDIRGSNTVGAQRLVELSMKWVCECIRYIQMYKCASILISLH